MKKILALVLSFMLVLSSVPFAFAATEDEGVTLVVEANDTDAMPGDNVSFSVYLRGADTTDGVNSVELWLDIPEGLTVTGMVAGMVPGWMLEVNENTVGVVGAGATSFTGDEACLATVTCAVDEDAAGDLVVSIDESAIFDNDYNQVAHTVVSAAVPVHTHSFGTAWLKDENGHWHECDCGEPADFDAHELADATCTAPATCEVCGWTEGAALGHDWEDATCTTPKTCKTCGATEGAALGHIDENNDWVCDRCGGAMCTEHDWAAATCTEPETCQICGETRGEALGHDTVHVPGYPATCTEDGLTDGEYCNRCGEFVVKQEILYAHGHDWTLMEVTEDGIIWQCLICDATMLEELNANTTIEVRPDGTVVITTINEDGTITIEIRKDGVTVILHLDANYTILSMKVIISTSAAAAADKSGKPIALPMDGHVLLANGAVNIEFTVYYEKSVAVEIPVKDVNEGCVYMIVNEDADATAVANTKMTETGLVFGCADGMTAKIVNNAMSFADVKGSAWYGDAVAFVTARGIMNGTGNNSFAPASTTTRVQVWAMLARLSGVEAYGAEWATIARQWAMENGITDGERANDSITRQELVTMLYRFVGEKGETKSVSSFSDAGNISNWAKAAMEWAYAEGVMNGNADGTLNPTGNATRAEMAQFFLNFIQNV